MRGTNLKSVIHVSVFLLAQAALIPAAMAQSSTATPSAAASGNMAIPCIDDSGKVANPGGGVCKNILPKCSDLHATFEKTIRSQLQMKIWGYYQGKDVDLEQSTPDKLVGASLKYPVCSVVGHTMKYNGDTSDFEINNQTIASKASCGSLPGVTGHKDSKQVEFIFDNGQGGAWASYLLGAYPWLIRKHASDVITQIAPDLSNLSTIIQSSDSLKADFANLLNNMNNFYNGLASSAQDACTNNSDIITKCNSGGYLITDPANRICTLVKAQTAVNSAALPNMILTEIMNRVQKQYDTDFASMLVLSSSEFMDFFNACQSPSTGFLGLEKRKPFSCAASCMLGGDDYYTSTHYDIWKDGGGGSRNCVSQSWVNLSNGSVSKTSGKSSFGSVVGAALTGALLGSAGGIAAAVDEAKSTSGKYHSATTGSGRTVNLGYVGYVEYLIRKKVCGQNNLNDDSPCDTINIPDRAPAAADTTTK